ncbi:argininosuccinate lyase [Verrucomicrobia bacterium LW23]|nr:argininosuccinate lyase [Verrucomicrobia bacterium LW23]
MWGGRFTAQAAPRLLRFSESISFDWRLFAHDIRGSIAHATMLRKIGVLTDEELASIKAGLEEIRGEIERGEFTWSLEREDVHMNIEAILTSRTPAGAKLHTGRSRNDQVATDVRLWLKDQIDTNIGAIRALQSSLVDWAARDFDVVIPGYTHLQRAQPVLLAHHLLAYAEMLERDAGRLADCRVRTDVLPLGSGAIAGSTLPLDRAYVAQLLGFAKVSANSMDSVSDRDFIVEYCSAAALIAVHLSRLAEDLILWSSAEFGFVRIGDAYTTGSSLMPQKKNPDVAELTRGKSGRVIGNLMALLTLLKGLPMTYNRDLQEDKERLFDTADTLQACLEINADMLRDVAVHRKACAGAAADPLLLATDLADWLVTRGMPFREAHHAVGKAVARAEELRIPISELPIAELKAISPVYDETALDVFSISRALDGRTTMGAPNPQSVKAELDAWKARLGATE